MQNKTSQIKMNIIANNKIKYYVAFSYLNIKPLVKSRIFEYFDYDIEKAFFANENDLLKVSEYYDIQIPKNYLSKIKKLNLDECYKNAFLDEDVKILTYEDELYPPLLKEIPDFPLALYYKGDLDGIDYNFNLAIVGSRACSQEAKNALDSIISKLSNSNIVIVSGLAYGIDAKAHQCAIDNNLKTIAVIGSGLDYYYPSQNKKIYEDIINGAGVIFSEYPLKIPPMSQNFPQRNRIVVGMCKGTLVAEAQIKSGAMISANLTLDYNRELMCIPGNILNPNTSGIYHLIKNGAGIICDSNNLLNQMGWDIILKEEENKTSDLNENQSQVINSIALEAKSFDEISFEVSLSTSEIMVALTELELKGLIKQTNNKYYKIG